MELHCQRNMVRVRRERNWATETPAVDIAEAAKVVKYTGTCERAGLLFTPVGIDTFGGCGKLGRAFLEKLFSRCAKRGGTHSDLQEPGQRPRECWEQLMVALRRAIGDQLFKGLHLEDTTPFCGEQGQGAFFEDSPRGAINAVRGREDG